LVKGVKVKFDLNEYPEEVERDSQSVTFVRKEKPMDACST
jgi:hypothetical protein